MWWLQAMERVIGGESENIVNNDENRVLSDMKEKQALAEIEEKTGIPMPELIYKPTGMVFDGYEYGEVNSWGTLYYLYENNVIMINALSAENDATYAWSYAGEILSEEVVQTAYGSVTVREVREKNDEKASYLAQWTYHNHQYLIEGKLSFEEMKKIIENILF